MDKIGTVTISLEDYKKYEEYKNQVENNQITIMKYDYDYQTGKGLKKIINIEYKNVNELLKDILKENKVLNDDFVKQRILYRSMNNE